MNNTRRSGATLQGLGTAGRGSTGAGSTKKKEGGGGGGTKKRQAALGRNRTPVSSELLRGRAGALPSCWNRGPRTTGGCFSIQ